MPSQSRRRKATLGCRRASAAAVSQNNLTQTSEFTIMLTRYQQQPRPTVPRHGRVPGSEKHQQDHSDRQNSASADARASRNGGAAPVCKTSPHGRLRRSRHGRGLVGRCLIKQNAMARRASPTLAAVDRARNCTGPGSEKGRRPTTPPTRLTRRGRSTAARTSTHRPKITRTASQFDAPLWTSRSRPLA